MKIVDPNNTNHLIYIVPRYYTDLATTLNIYDEATKVNDVATNVFTTLNGVTTVNFYYNFKDKAKYQIKLTDVNGVVYRGKLMATSQDSQDYKMTKDLYFYE